MQPRSNVTVVGSEGVAKASSSSRWHNREVAQHLHHLETLDRLLLHRSLGEYSFPSTQIFSGLTRSHAVHRAVTLSGPPLRPVPQTIPPTIISSIDTVDLPIRRGYRKYDRYTAVLPIVNSLIEQGGQAHWIPRAVADHMRYLTAA